MNTQEVSEIVASIQDSLIDRKKLKRILNDVLILMERATKQDKKDGEDCSAYLTRLHSIIKAQQISEQKDARILLEAAKLNKPTTPQINLYAESESEEGQDADERQQLVDSRGRRISRIAAKLGIPGAAAAYLGD